VRCRRSRLYLSLLGVRRSRSAGGARTIGCVVQPPESRKVHWLTFLATSRPAPVVSIIREAWQKPPLARYLLVGRVWVTAEVLPTTQPPFSMGQELRSVRFILRRGARIMGEWQDAAAGPAGSRVTSLLPLSRYPQHYRQLVPRGLAGCRAIFKGRVNRVAPWHSLGNRPFLFLPCWKIRLRVALRAHVVLNMLDTEGPAPGGVERDGLTLVWQCGRSIALAWCEENRIVWK
jgi:hypothetical protein